MRSKGLASVLNQLPLLLLAVVFGIFGLMSGKFLEPQNLLNILLQSSAVAIAATGMTFVLLAAGVDLSVGSVMFAGVAVGGKLIYGGQPLWVGFGAALGIGLLAGSFNGLVVTRARIAPFIATLAMLFAARGFGLWFTRTRAMNMPEAVTHLGASKLLGIPVPILVAAFVCVVAHVVLTRTPFGRRVHAVGQDPEAARRAGVGVGGVLFAAYAACGLCAAASGLVSLTQTGAVSPSFGEGKEFAAITAAVLGGTSLFGGRGSVLPGAVLGAVLIQTVETGLVIVNADPYIYPVVTGGIIFLAVLMDCGRNQMAAQLNRRRIYPEGEK